MSFRERMPWKIDSRGKRARRSVFCKCLGYSKYQKKVTFAVSIGFWLRWRAAVILQHCRSDKLGPYFHAMSARTRASRSFSRPRRDFALKRNKESERYSNQEVDLPFASRRGTSLASLSILREKEILNNFIWHGNTIRVWMLILNPRRSFIMQLLRHRIDVTFDSYRHLEDQNL